MPAKDVLVQELEAPLASFAGLRRKGNQFADPSRRGTLVINERIYDGTNVETIRV